MEASIAAFGQIAGFTGVVGVTIGAFVFIARDLIAKGTFPKLLPSDAFKGSFALLFMAWTVAVLGISVWGYVAINKNAVASNQNQQPVSSTKLPGETGWILAGYFNPENNTFIQGPYISVDKPTGSSQRGLVKMGDTIELKQSAKVIIVDFKTSGTDKKRVSPSKAGIIGSEDETGVTLPQGAKLIVRAVSKKRWSNSQNAALWLRVGNI